MALGQLEGALENTWHVTTLTLDSIALEKLFDGTLDIWMDIDAEFPSPHGGWAVTLGSSTLTIDYDEVVIVPDPPVDPPVTIPAPGAILLGSIGIGFVGWLRRRRTL